MRYIRLFCAVAPLLLAGPADALAGDKIIDELRIGGAASINGSKSREDGAIGSVELYFDPLEDTHASTAGKLLLEPRIHIGASGGPDATDRIYTGLTWDFPITEKFFAEIGAGGTIHNGSLDGGDRPRLGCRVLFREHAALGYRVTEHVQILATIDHSSNADLCDGPNDGLTQAGLSVGYKF
ncbi:MAG: acyloxyacyl hydrolase [Shinella sp.]|nr:acyloxyacyl hydrolase [Shinella sp.]